MYTLIRLLQALALLASRRWHKSTLKNTEEWGTRTLQPKYHVMLGVIVHPLKDK